MVAACLGGAWGQSGAVSYSVSTRNGVKTASVEGIDRNGVLYVPLGSLVNQMGGGYTVAPDRTQIDLSEKSAWVRPNNPQVNASLGVFMLGAPVLQTGDEILIAAGDVAVFFEKAFRLAARQVSASSRPPDPSNEPEPDALEPLGTEAPDEAPDETPVEALEPLVTNSPVETLPSPAGSTPVEPAAPAEAAPEQEAPGVDLMAKAAVDGKEGPAAAPDRPLDRAVAVVVIDPGHGGTDAGGQGASGVKEPGVAFSVAEKLRQALEKGSPLKTVLTREKDISASRTERVFAANGRKGDLLISLHTGAALSGSQQGCRLFVCGPNGEYAGARYAERSRELATAVADAIAEATGRASGGIYRLDCHVVEEAAMPGLMVELGMLTNPEEERLLGSEEYQSKLAAGIAAGIKEFMEARKP